MSAKRSPSLLQSSSRRSLIRSGIATALAMPLAHAFAAARGPSLGDLRLDDATLLEAFMKLRGSTDGRITIGWIDAVNYAFVEGETFPLYRLFAATWQRAERTAETTYAGRQIEIAFFLDMRTGEPLKQLTMPRTNRTVEVPLYRAGPSPSTHAVRHQQKREFEMQRETRQGASFFKGGVAYSEQYLSQPQRDGDRFSVRQDIATRVVPGDPAARPFFYREWTINDGSWAELSSPAVKSARCDIAYFATTAWRPWMQMGDVPGQTLQNGRGGKVGSAEELPPEIFALTRKHHPDVIDSAAKLLA
jgi:hypothetical protein